APLRPAKTSVKVFDISETPCSTIGSILVNDVIHCRDKSGDIAGCVDRLSTSSKLAVSLLK
ncbi:MAG TPA: Tat pathway signal sequence domain protein, partial [Stellaceae bacterium]|nr:Tat pathway signal sequence domain protein [Stellaceae bacterium]